MLFVAIVGLFRECCGCRRCATETPPSQIQSVQEDACPFATELEAIRPHLQNGDLILRQGKTLASYFIIHSTEPNQNYTHIGIIFIHNGTVSVVNAEDDETANGDGQVKQTTLEEFVKNSTAVAVFRLNASEELRNAMAKASLDYLGIPFDDEMILDDTRKIFCTELLEIAMQDAHFPLMPRRVQSPLFRRIILPPDSFTAPELAKPLLPPP